jgi:hypothetical protein
MLLSFTPVRSHSFDTSGQEHDLTAFVRLATVPLKTKQALQKSLPRHRRNGYESTFSFVVTTGLRGSKEISVVVF